MGSLRSTTFLFTGSLLAAALTGRPGTARAEDLDPPEVAPHQILVDLRDDTSDEDERQVEVELGGLHLHLNSAYAKKDHNYIADVNPADFERLIKAVKDDPRVEHVEPNFIYQALMIPDDPLWSEQWSFVMVDAPTAWDYATGKGVVVAVIDTGVAFKARKGYAQVEDSAGTSFTKGYDFVNDDDDATDDHGHGTHVAGTIAQSTNNGIGVAGLAHGATIMPIKVLDKLGRGTAADIADAIRWAADEGAQVINMSLGGGSRSLTMQSAVAYARKKGVIVVCAAGNNGRGTVEFPAAYPGAFAVSSVGPRGQLAAYSSWGKQIAVAAPGGDKNEGGDKGGILQNTIDPRAPGAPSFYAAFQGTSMAAPHVAGAAALVISAGVTDPDKVEQILRSTARPAGNKGGDERYGSGILDAGAAVKAAAGESGGGAGYLLSGLGALGLYALRQARRKVDAVKLGVGALAGVVIGASGLWFLSAFGAGRIPGAGFVTHAMPSWDLVAFGAGAYHSAIWASALPVFALVTAFLGAPKLRGFLIGLSLGWAAHLALSAILMPADVQLIPGVAGLLDRAWLAVNAGALGLIAVLIGRR